MSIPQLEYMYSLDQANIVPGLERIQAVLQQLNNPENTFPSIHITGTNGKGSVTAMIDSVLRASGKKVGMYTSPHIYAFNERIKVNGVSISDTDLAATIDDVKAAADKAGVSPTFFEFTTAVCFLHFSRQHLDVAVIEVGLGGLLDATNVITPIASVITNIGLDHQEYLGDTKEAIATEKSGIIKPGAVVVTGEVDPAMLAILNTHAQKAHTEMVKAYDVLDVRLVSESLEGQTVAVTGAWEGELTLPLLGIHQLANLQVALALLANIPDTMRPTFTQVQQGISSLTWEGRMDIVSKNPFVLIDGAHNADGLSALTDFLQTLPRTDVLLLGLKQGKQVDTQLQELATLFDHVIVTEGNFMPLPADEVVRKLSGNVTAIPHVADAFAAAQEKAGSEGVLVVAGSLYVVADVLQVIRNKKVI